MASPWQLACAFAAALSLAVATPAQESEAPPVASDAIAPAAAAADNAQPQPIAPEGEGAPAVDAAAGAELTAASEGVAPAEAEDPFDAAAAPAEPAVPEEDAAPAASAASAAQGAEAATEPAAAPHEDEHHGPGAAPVLVNFALYVGILVFLLRKPVAAFFRQRREGITGALEAAEIAQRSAQARLDEAEAKLAGLDAQVEQILSTARAHAETERAQILDKARTDVARVLAQAEAQVGDMEAAAVRRLRAAAAELAVDLARELVEKNLQPKDRDEIFNRTLTRLQKTAG